MANFGYFVMTLLLSIPQGIVCGWGLTKLWNWFMVTLKLPQIHLVQAIGIMIVVNFFTVEIDLDEESKTASELLIYNLSKLLMTTIYVISAVGIGWCWYKMM